MTRSCGCSRMTQILRAALDPAEATTAAGRALANVLRAEPGTWEPPAPSPELRDGFGLLVLDGLLTRELVLAGLGRSELLGKGDVVRPWGDEEGVPSVPLSVDWSALEPPRIALLDRSFATEVAPWPAIAAALVARLVRRSHSLAMHLAISRLVGIDPSPLRALLPGRPVRTRRLARRDCAAPLDPCDAREDRLGAAAVGHERARRAETAGPARGERRANVDSSRGRAARDRVDAQAIGRGGAYSTV
jgi:hypothetical protein